MKKKVILNKTEQMIDIIQRGSDSLTFSLEKKEYHFRKINDSTIEFEGKNYHFATEKFGHKGVLQVFMDDLETYIEFPGKVQGKKQGLHSEGSLESPMPGKIFKILKSKGEKVKANEPILILEAMKMEHTIKAQKEGVVKNIFFKEGEQVAGGAPLCEIE